MLERIKFMNVGIELALDPLLRNWLLEDIGRGDVTTQSLFEEKIGEGQAQWIIKENGVIAGLPIAKRVFQLLDKDIKWQSMVVEGEECREGQIVAELEGRMDALLIGERLALNLVMNLSGIATLTRQYAEVIADLPTKLVDTRKTTPGLRILEKYATRLGGAINHRMGLDDAVMIKDNHIKAAGGIKAAITEIRKRKPYPLTIEVETSNLSEVQVAVEQKADIIMLDNMVLPMLQEAVKIIRESKQKIKIEASGNVTLENLRLIAETGVDYISSSAPITKSHWLDLSMRIKQNQIAMNI